MAPGDQDDTVVQELDVYLNNGAFGHATQVLDQELAQEETWAVCLDIDLLWTVQLYLLQYPLRPPRRPYGTDQADKVRQLTSMHVSHSSQHLGGCMHPWPKLWNDMRCCPA